MIRWVDQDKGPYFNLKLAWLRGMHGGQGRNRHLPMIPAAQLHLVSADTQTWFWSRLAVKPDLVYRYRHDHLVIEYKSRAGTVDAITFDNWRQSVRVEDMVQVSLGGLAVAQANRRYSLCLLHYGDALVCVEPSPDLLLDMYRSIPKAAAFLGVKPDDRIRSGEFARMYAARLARHGLRWVGSRSAKKGVQSHTRFVSHGML